MDYNIKSGRNSKIQERRVFEVPRPRRIQRTAPGGTVVDALKVKVFDGGKTNPSHKYPEKRPDRAYIAIQHMKLSSFPPRKRLLSHRDIGIIAWKRKDGVPLNKRLL